MGTPDDATALLLLAARLDDDGRPFVAAAARQAATAVQEGHPPHAAVLRRQAIEVAVHLDALGLPAEAQTVFDEIVRRATNAEGAMTDRLFRVWLDAIQAQFPRPESPEASR